MPGAAAVIAFKEQGAASPPRRNKRKSLEPKKLTGPGTQPNAVGPTTSSSSSSSNNNNNNNGSSSSSGGEEDACGTKRRRLGSTGSEESPHLLSSSSCASRTPSPASSAGSAAAVSMHPKMRFKQAKQSQEDKDLHRRHRHQQPPSSPQQQQQQQQQQQLKNPFRPWDLATPSAAPATADASAAAAAAAAAASPSNVLASLLPQMALDPRFLALSPELRAAFLASAMAQQQAPQPRAEPRQQKQPQSAVSPTPSFLSAYTPPPEQDEPLSLVKHDRQKMQVCGNAGGRSDVKNLMAQVAVTKAGVSGSGSGGGGPSSGSAEKLARQRRIQQEQERVERVERERQKVELGEGGEGGEGGAACSAAGLAKQRNYKNMTRERRVEANARERQRVHTITAAFDTLQAAIPTPTDTGDAAAGQKLSKLSIIKIATSYIMVLSRMAGYDYSVDQSEPSVEECIENCAELIRGETKVKKRLSA